MTDIAKFGVETHKGFVNTWECDENNHLNVQFYWKRFSEASTIYCLLNGLTASYWQNRHVRYHNEIRMGALTVIRSAVCTTQNKLVHIMFDGSDGSLIATSIEDFSHPDSDALSSSQIASIPTEALPRSVSSEALEPTDIARLVKSGSARLTNRSAVQPSHCDEDGTMLDQFLISRFSDAAPHLLNSFGLSRTWLMDRNLGGAAVEMKVTRLETVRTGMMLEINSWFVGRADKTLSLRHQVSDMNTGAIVYCGAVTVLIFDLSARKAISLPQEISSQHNQLSS